MPERNSESEPVLPPSRFGAGFSVGGPEPQPGYPPQAFAASEPPPPQIQYPASQQYPAPPQYPVVVPVAYMPAPKTNGLAIAAFVCPLVLCVLFPLGIIFGHIALSQIARTGEGGRGLAIAGLVISYVLAAIVVFAFMLPTFGFILM